MLNCKPIRNEINYQTKNVRGFILENGCFIELNNVMSILKKNEKNDNYKITEIPDIEFNKRINNKKKLYFIQKNNNSKRIFFYKKN